MKLLTISRSKLEIARAQLRKPLIVIGRSPTCDVVLRAPGVKPVHFIVEWIGSGVFDPNAGTWSIADVSAGSQAGEGIVLTQEVMSIGDLSFRAVDDQLESSEIIGGKILESLSAQQARDPSIIECVQVRTDSGAIENVVHYPVKRKPGKAPLSREFRTFRLEWVRGQSETLVNLLLEEMPGAEIWVSGRKVEGQKLLKNLRPSDFIQVKWNGRDFYIRFVEEVKSPAIPRDFWGDPLLKKIALLSWIGALLLAMLLIFLPKPEEPEKELPRVARIEVPPVDAPPPPPPEVAPPPPPPAAEKVVEKAVKKEPMKSKEPELQLKKKAPEKPSKAAAPKVISKPEAKPKAGLNAPAPVEDVNRVGLLGMLNKDVKKGKGVEAEKILDQGIIKETATAPDNSRVLLQSPPAGVIGSGSGGDPKGKGSKNLGAASTTLSGVSKYDPNSIGPIARKGGQSGYQIGSGLSGTGSGGGGGNTVGSLEGGDFSVEGGGLDRETVRRIIASYRGQIRTCYERALISSPKLEGRVVYNWRISAQGAVVTTKVVKSTVESANLQTCVLEVIQKMVFPKAANGLATTVIYPFVFQGKR